MRSECIGQKRAEMEALITSVRSQYEDYKVVEPPTVEDGLKLNWSKCNSYCFICLQRLMNLWLGRHRQCRCQHCVGKPSNRGATEKWLMQKKFLPDECLEIRQSLETFMGWKAF